MELPTAPSNPLSRRRVGQLLLGASLVGLVGCGDDDVSSGSSTTAPDDTVPPTDGPPPTEPVGERDEADPTLIAPVVEATNRFAGELYPLIVEDGQNLAFSPTSIAIALAMTAPGGSGATRTEIESVLGIDDVADPHGGWNALDQALASRAGTVETPEGETLEVGLRVVNQLWAQEGFAIEEAFLALMAASYGAGVELVDFVAEPEQSRNRINAWVAEQTNDRIPELIPEGAITDITRLVLTNALWFKAPWTIPFGPAFDAPFELLDGGTVEVPTMSNDGPYGSSAGDGWEAVTLPYAGDDLEMVLLVPDEGRFEEMEARLADDLFGEVASGEPARLQLTLPLFEIRSPVPLKQPLEDLGMPQPFDPAVADFRGLNADLGRQLFIQDVIHEAWISVDEEGTEAAAATAVIIGIESAPPSVTVDRPFLWAIRDIPTGLLLFVGRVVDPSE